VHTTWTWLAGELVKEGEGRLYPCWINRWCGDGLYELVVMPLKFRGAGTADFALP